MRYLIMLVTAVALTARQAPTLDAVTDFLLTAAATDFNTHRQVEPARFRNVRLGHVTSASGEKAYRICGEFLPKGDPATGQWMRFATVQTSGYEQWLGEQSARYCHGSGFSWDQAADLSTRLQQRLDSLRAGDSAR